MNFRDYLKEGTGGIMEVSNGVLNGTNASAGYSWTVAKQVDGIHATFGKSDDFEGTQNKKMVAKTAADTAAFLKSQGAEEKNIAAEIDKLKTIAKS
jgi:hypothetical protein